MKKIFILFFLLFSFFFATAQKELWGYKVQYNYAFTGNLPNVYGNDGQIIKVPLEGTTSTFEVMHTFDVTGLEGKFPKGRLLQASNGKLYGITCSYTYDLPSGTTIAEKGVLFEYDPILNKYTVLSKQLTGRQENEYAVIEPTPNIIYGTTNNGSSIFKYNILTNTYSVVATIPAYQVFSGSNQPRFIGELMKASDGFLYGVTDIAPYGPTNNDTSIVGAIYRFNMTTNQLTKMYVFGVNDQLLNVYFPIFGTVLVEAVPGKLYGTANGGNHIGPPNSQIAPLGSGTLFEYTIATNTVAKKVDFDYNVNGSGPSPLMKGPNSKLYGTLFSNPVINIFPSWAGAIFEYDAAVGALNIVHNMNPPFDPTFNLYQYIGLYSSNTNIYVSNNVGVYQYNFTSNGFTQRIASTGPNGNDTNSLIEICRKPSYNEFPATAFTPCVNTPFTFDVQNTNATSYVWKKDAIVLPAQTTGILNIPNLTITDTGTYTCTMTNVCGITVTMPLQINVSCLGVEEIIGTKNDITLYPNPTKNLLNIKLPENKDFEINKITIVNLLGQTVVENVKIDSTIDVSTLQKGIYILNLKTDKGDWNGKFIKE